MKQLLYALLVLSLVGCSTTQPVRQEVVTISKPVPFVPVPPMVPKCVSMVDQLVTADIKDPGKVGQAYKYDMLCFRQRDIIIQMILDQYRTESQNFDAINRAIEAMAESIRKQATP